MKTLITLAVATIVCVGALGCGGEVSKKKTETTTTTPSGETKTSTEVKVETKGDDTPAPK
jgi:hypothetical protein